MRAVLVRRILPFAGPRIMRHHFGKGDLVLIHQPSRQLRGSLGGCRSAIAGMLTHFDANAVSVSRTIKIGVISLLGRRKMLHRDILINRVMPRETPQRTTFERERMATGIGPFTPILGRMNCNITGAHRLTRPTSRPVREVIILDPNLPHETGCADPTAPHGGSGFRNRRRFL